jgi:membrane fusion protein (multidrug efflux system)
VLARLTLRRSFGVKRSSVIAGVLVFVVIAVIASAVYLTRRSSDAKAAAKAQTEKFEPAAATLVVEARKLPFQPESDLVGTVVALRSVMVASELSGTVREVQFESGAIVDKGTVLLTMDDSTEQADLRAAQATVRVSEANIAVADARLRLAQTNLDRLSQAVAVNAAPVADLDRAKAELDQARADRERLLAEVDQSKARAAYLQTKIDKHVIRAPFRGRVGLRNIHPGAYLAEGGPIVMLQEVGEKIFLDFAIPQEYLVQVAPGYTVMASSPMLSKEPVKIEVVSVDATANNDTRNVRVRSLVNNPGERLRQGMSVEVRVPVGPSFDYVVVPSTAIRRATYADHVWVAATSTDSKDPPGTLRAQQRFVKLGPTLGSDVVVTEGITPGELVCADGSFKLMPNMKIMRADPKGAAPANAAGASKAKPEAKAESKPEATKH